MHRCIAILLFLAAAIPLAAQPGKAPNTPVFTGMPDKVEKLGKLRILHGQVMDPADKPLEKAVVYLKDKHTQKVVTVTTGKDGLFHFGGLDPNQDYELRAEHDGAFSTTRLLSMLDGRKDVALNLKVEPKKADDKKSPDDKKSTDKDDKSDKKAPAKPASPDDKKPDSTKPDPAKPDPPRPDLSKSGESLLS
jgi:hypothetical protein